MAFWLGFLEIVIWLTVISTVIHKIKEIPILGVFYALGLATGNEAGIKIEKWLALGCIILRVISRKGYHEMTSTVRQAGYAVTTFHGEGKTGPVVELYIVCHRKDLKKILQIVHQIEPDVFLSLNRPGP